MIAWSTRANIEQYIFIIIPFAFLPLLPHKVAVSKCARNWKSMKMKCTGQWKKGVNAEFLNGPSVLLLLLHVAKLVLSILIIII